MESGELKRIIEALLLDAGITPRAGVDEAGRGACAGPLVVASVILKDPFHPDLAPVRDSKEIKENKREVLFDLVMAGIGGWGFIKAVRENKLCENAIYIVLSNQGQQIDFDTAKSYNVDGYVIKALSTPTEVLTEVEKIYKEKKS